ncbi:MAG: MFS transporter [Candidatus Omnitrophica bacterium]|nr:MFS transporter [Candidatus Omnitrophota bacterium]
MPVLVPSISFDFGLEQFFVGRIIWLYMLPYGITALFYGILAKIFEVRKIELVCFLLFSLSNLWAGLSKTIYELFLARFFMGLFGASVIPLALILIAKNKEYSQRGKLVGIFFSVTFVFSLLGLFLSGLLHWRWIFLIPAFLGLCLWLAMYFYFPDFISGDRIYFEYSMLKEIPKGYVEIFKNKKPRNIFLYIFIISLLYHSIHQWLGVYFFLKFNLDKLLISILITLSSLSGIFGEYLGGRLSDIFGRYRIINLGLILMIISIILLTFKIPIFLLAIAMIIWGLGWTVNHAGLSTLLADLPKDYLYEAAGLNSSVRFLSGGMGVFLIRSILQNNFVLGFFITGSILGILFLFSKNFIGGI